MCLILFAHQAHPDFALVLAANRDEFFARPTTAADYWEDAPEVLGGRDLEKGGTWMGVTRDGRWSAVTNYRDGTRPEAGTRSRGQMVARFLTENADARSYAESIARSASAYHGFNLLAGDASDLYYVSHAEGKSRRVEPGVHGLSNDRLDTPWPKVERGRRRLQSMLSGDAEVTEEDLLAVLADRDLAQDHLLPQTGIPYDWEKRLSASFIVSPAYGTRASSVLLIGMNGEVRFRERSFDENGELLEDRMFRFTISA
ncbi:MAG TPA: NRDE family protein [Burkholderiales bacterium]